jgi:pyrroline-5-carboxylate reductase
MRVGFAGAGNMAAAMARGWAAARDAGQGGPGEMLFTDGGSGAAAELAAEVGGRSVASNRELAESSDLVILAMKPAQLDAVAGEMGDTAREVVSVLAGTPLTRLGGAFPEAGVVRVMPNVAVEVRRGVLCVAAPEGADELSDRVMDLLAPLGSVHRIDDQLMNAATAIMSSSPAYISLVAEALAGAGAREGLDERVAQTIVTEAIAGTAELLAERDTLSVRRSVTSPAGATAAGLAALDRAGVRAAFEEAVQAAIERMREL